MPLKWVLIFKNFTGWYPRPPPPPSKIISCVYILCKVSVSKRLMPASNSYMLCLAVICIATAVSKQYSLHAKWVYCCHWLQWKCLQNKQVNIFSSIFTVLEILACSTWPDMCKAWLNVEYYENVWSDHITDLASGLALSIIVTVWDSNSCQRHRVSRVWDICPFHDISTIFHAKFKHCATKLVICKEPVIVPNYARMH